MPVIRINNRSRSLKLLAGWLVLALAPLLSHALCRAQDTSRCANSTVEDAWGPAVASEARSFLVRLQRIVKTGDKKQFASLIHYPIRVLDGKHSIEISSPSDFVEKYSSILTPDVKHAILAQSATCLFGNGQGMMVGRGQLWFRKESSGDMKIITINLSAPRVRRAMISASNFSAFWGPASPIRSATTSVSSHQHVGTGYSGV